MTPAIRGAVQQNGAGNRSRKISSKTPSRWRQTQALPYLGDHRGDESKQDGKELHACCRVPVILLVNPEKAARVFSLSPKYEYSRSPKESVAHLKIAGTNLSCRYDMHRRLHKKGRLLVAPEVPAVCVYQPVLPHPWRHVQLAVAQVHAREAALLCPPLCAELRIRHG